MCPVDALPGAIAGVRKKHQRLHFNGLVMTLQSQMAPLPLVPKNPRKKKEILHCFNAADVTDLILTCASRVGKRLDAGRKYAMSERCKKEKTGRKGWKLQRNFHTLMWVDPS